MAATRSYEIRLNEKSISHAVAEAWPELTRYQDNYYCLLEDHDTLKETAHSAKKKAEDCRAKINELYEKLDTHRATIKNLGDQAQSLEAELQAKGNSSKLLNHEELILENKRLQKELDYYVRRARFALYGKDANWATRNGYRISDIPASDGEDNNEDQSGLPTIPEEIPQYRPSRPPVKLTRPVGKSNQNDYKVVPEAGIPAIGGSCLPHTQKRIIANPPASIMGVLPKPLGKSRAECWDQPTLRGTSDWIMESDIHDSEMRRLYVEDRALQPHLRTLDHTAVMFCIDEYARSLPGPPRNLVVRHDDPNWMVNVVQAFNANPSGIPRNLRLEGLHPKARGAEAEVLLQSIFSTVGKWDQIIAGQWKRNDSSFLCSPTPARYQIHRNQKFDRREFAYWLGCDTGVTPALAQDKLEPYFVRRVTKTIWNEVTLCSQLRANEIASLKGGVMNQFRVHEDLLPLDEPDPELNLIQHSAGSSSLADRLDYGEGGSFSQPPANAHELQARISYFDSLVPQGTIRASMAELTEELTCDLYADNLE
ncbi:hypothetical protein M422DRAFT_270276 [Sphaerobolus stellatus SS14]|uniref:Uncharacterized protein n=1 Tax=Sphaerobolus stellatus (strain SS14) TaxID=990650 RepID=A0A0C9USY5_SPHS4|nr:hypothetical protein M422DRAFT_270276 [Sphaerobolus stellatus SS14]